MTADLDMRDSAGKVPAPVLDICRRLSAAGHQAFLVGGAVRDLLLGREAHDFDVATSAVPDDVTAIFGRRRTIPTGAAHGTVTVLVDKEVAERAGLSTHVEVTTFRGEGAYADGRRPDSVAFHLDLVEDLRRRDFTINAMAIDPAVWQLRDPFGGREDLAARVLRAVGDPAQRFAEDGLRIMRAVRFAAQLDFALEAATEAAIPGAIAVFRKVSLERVRDELVKLLAAPRPSSGLSLMLRTGILDEILPEVSAAIGLVTDRARAAALFDETLATVDATCGDAIVRLAALLRDLGEPRGPAAGPRPTPPLPLPWENRALAAAGEADEIGRRLRLSNKERERVVALVANHLAGYSPAWTDGALRRFMARAGVELLPDLFALREGELRAQGRTADLEAELGPLRRRVDAELASGHALKAGDLRVTGADVMRVLAARPGPIVGVVLRRLLDRVLDDPTLNERAALERLIPEAATEEGQ